MHRADEDDVAGMFTETAPGTKVTDDWLNDVQENLAQFIEAQSIVLVKGTYTQLTSAVTAAIDTATAALKAAANTWDLLQTYAKGIAVTQSTSNTPAGTFAGNGTAPGATFTGGGTGGGGYGSTHQGGGTNGAGLNSTGGGSGAGAILAGGPTGPGAVISAGVNTRGAIEFGGTNPAATVGFTNSLAPSNVPKAWGRLTTDAAGGVTVTAGFNVASASISGANILVNFATAMGSTAYAVFVQTVLSSTNPGVVNSSASQFTISAANTAVDPTGSFSFATNATNVNFVVFGTQ